MRFLAFFAFFLPGLLSCQQPGSSGLMPLPSSYKAQKGLFVLKAPLKIYYPDVAGEWAAAAEFFKEMVRRGSGIEAEKAPYAQVPSRFTDGHIYVLPDLDLKDPEAYALEVRPDAVLIRAADAAGAFYAFQTLRQLFPPGFNGVKPLPAAELKAPCCRIEDAPRFPYRGLHLDAGRHFFPISFIKRYIDLLAFHKLNRFHWHLTEDQGWRMEVKAFPELQTRAAYRKETLVGHYADGPHRFDGKPYGGFYTQSEIREVVEYARSRFVEIIPEIEMPGHAMAALCAYPELGCTGGPYETATSWGVFEDVFCAGNEKTFAFLEKVLSETAELFPGKYIHIGGDECPKTRWEACSKCKKRMKEEGLKDGHELQSYFIKRIEKILAGKGKKLIGWDEILEGGLAPSATVMSWRGTEGGIAAAKAGHDAVMTPNDYYYFDYYQGDPAVEPLAIGGNLPLEKVYHYEPLPAGFSKGEAQRVIGVQGNVWTEYLSTPDKVEYMAWPRACALAETAWSNPEKKDFPDFINRLMIHLDRLQSLKVNYSSAMFEVKHTFTGDKIALSGTLPNADIRYTLDGTTPNKHSAKYKNPISPTQTTLVKAAVLNPSGEPAGRVSESAFYVHKAFQKTYTLGKTPEKYDGGSRYALTDGITGKDLEWKHWVGLVNRDVDPVIYFGETTEWERVRIRFLNDKNSSIYPPRSVTVYTSDDGARFKLLAQVNIDAEELWGRKAETLELKTPGARGKYLKVLIQNYGAIPAGAPNAGAGAWLFVDEIQVD